MKPQVNEKLRLAGCVYARPTAAIRLRPGSDQEGLVPAAATAGLARCTRRCCYATLSEGWTVTAPGVEASGDTMQITSPDETAALIDQLRTSGNTHLRPGYPDHPYWRQRHRSGHRRAGSLTPQETTAQRKEEEEQLTHSPPPKARPG